MGLLKEEYPNVYAELLKKENEDIIDVDNVSSGSSKKVSWKCVQDPSHVFHATIKNRTRRGSGCPYCSGRLATPDKCLEVLRPAVAQFLEDQSLGKSLTVNSRKKVNFLCDKGHHWTIRPIDYNGVKDENICPYCSNREVLVGYNDLFTMHPDIAQEWDAEKNDSSPHDHLPSSRKTVSWVCEHGHQWDAQIFLRALRGSGCHVCWGRKVVSGVNDVATTHPEVVALWDSSKNDKSITEFTAGSNHKAHWVCHNGHEYTAMITKVALGGQRCSICSGQKIIPGVNDMFTLYPHTKEIWDWSNNTVDPNAISPGTSRVVSWKCAKHGHTWDAPPARVTRGNISAGCPICANQVVLTGFNDLQHKFPDLVNDQWDWDRNNSDKLHPHEVTYGSSMRAHWVCEEGHKWDTQIYKRTQINGTGCPVCINQKVVIGTNDLQHKFPDLVNDQWDWEKNTKGGLDPQSLSYVSKTPVWWKCDEGHSWSVPVYKRTKENAQCPRCFGYSSRQEREVRDYVESLVGEDNVVACDRKMIYPYELDIYVPSKNIAIEFNGLYWHSESAGKNKFYHHTKWKRCKDNGVQLLTIWEDEWTHHGDIVRSMLARKLGVSKSPSVFARNTVACSVGVQQSRDFCNNYHIQGFASGSVYIALVDKSSLGDTSLSYQSDSVLPVLSSDDCGSIVALSVWRKNKDVLYLDRYCTSTPVVGGMGKLLKHGVRYATDNNMSSIVTFADHQVSDGGLYETLGFTVDKELEPDYKYLYGYNRVHKFNFRRDRFKKDNLLEYHDGLTEEELAILNDIPRVWDCGKTRYIITM